MRKQAVVLGTGFFALYALNATYDAFLPLLLRNFISNLAVIGFLMTIDNYIALLSQPWWGSRSDGTRTRLGRRVPYLLIGMSLTALFAVLVPLGGQLSLWLLLGGGLLFGGKGYAPFVLVAIALLGAALIITRKLSEPAHTHHEPRRHDLLVPLKALRGLAARPHKDPLLFLGGALCFQLAIAGTAPYFTLYVRELFSLTPGQAGTLASLTWIGALVATLPAGCAG